MNIATDANFIEFSGIQFPISRPHWFGVVLEPPVGFENEDYLHNVLLVADNRESFLGLIESEGLVVCKKLRTDAPSYRKVRGKSSHGKLSQAEYYHHDGCSCPTKPTVVEIRLPYQPIERNVHTAIAWLPDVIKAQLMALPSRFGRNPEFVEQLNSFSGSADDFPAVETWDQIQGRITRLVRKEMDAESCRAYFREVDKLAGAYVVPWEMGESRLMINNAADLAKTTQHRRAFQKPKKANEQNGSLVKRWTAEEA